MSRTRLFLGEGSEAGVMERRAGEKIIIFILLLLILIKCPNVRTKNAGTNGQQENQTPKSALSAKDTYESKSDR